MLDMLILDDKLTLTEQEFEQISRLVYDYCGINLHDGKKELVRSRLAKILRQRGIATFREYLEFIQSDSTGAAFSELIDALSTNLTSFFRESVHFQFLSEKFLPAALEKKQRTGNLKIRGWSAGCSTGEEPYSIAITLLDSIPDANRWDIKVLATDVSTRVLKTAQEGVYEPQRIAPVPTNQRNVYLKPCSIDGQTYYAAKDCLKNLIVFKHLNLMSNWPFRGPFDFIFCRNVMIYFDKPTQQRLIERFWQVLADGGILFTGHSESLTGIRHQFRYVQPTIYRKG